MDFIINEIEENIQVILMQNDKQVAKATCYWKNTPQIDGKNIGTIGELEIKQKELGEKLLEKCEEILKQKGVKHIVAPMNGNTWKQYRTLKYTNGDSMFLLENVNPIEDNEILLKAGFKEIYTYTSTKGLIKDAYQSEALNLAEENLKGENISIRKFNKENYLEDLKKIYNVSIKSFNRNPLYTPIEEKDFIGQYEKYIPMVDDELILIEEKDGQEVGFVFCIPNFNEPGTLILKTIAVLPEYEDFAIGNVMLKDIAEIAKQKGFEKWIFAFMYKNNTSQKMAKRNNTEIIREYAIYGKDI